ncbi:MAG: endonuclease Q family protein [candidate division FCPU426 bacterium]
MADLSPQPRPLVFADLHLHSKFSRATSSQMEVASLHYWGRRKGLQLLATGDFTHPEYFRQLTEQLEPDESGFYRLRGAGPDVRFVLSAETSHIYKQAGKTRRVHMLFLARSLETAREINRALASRGNVASDGRPIFGFSARHLCELLRGIDPETLVIPAHIWTPWFSVLGEQSGFDSLEECFEDETGFLAAAETGLSSDPEMNWRLSQLDRVALISNSDAHSPSRLGRECNVFRGPLTWTDLGDILRRKDRERFRFTVEFFPEEGKYHWPGHSACRRSASPAEYREWGGRCPVCGKPFTGGVASRVEQLADRPAGFVPPEAVPSVHLIPLDEIVAEALGKKPASKGVQRVWDQLVEQGGSELEILLFAPENQVAEWAGGRVAEALMRMRRGAVSAVPGYDGVYGRIRLFDDEAAPADVAPDAGQLSWLEAGPRR